MINISNTDQKQEHEVKQLLEHIETLLLDSTKIPIVNKLLVDEDKLFELLDALTANLPKEIEESKKITNDVDNIMSKARAEATQLLQNSEARARELLQTSESKSKEMLSYAENKSKELKESSEREAKEKLEYAESQSALILSEDETLKRIQQEVDKLKKDSLESYNKTKEESDNYAEYVLDNLEMKLARTLSLIRSGKEKISSM